MKYFLGRTNPLLHNGKKPPKNTNNVVKLTATQETMVWILLNTLMKFNAFEYFWIGNTFEYFRESIQNYSNLSFELNFYNKGEFDNIASNIEYFWILLNTQQII